tara:strand:+ start:3438 stop:3764 length:327 start_codon:yes stop_codon:yes gene_type:complete
MINWNYIRENHPKALKLYMSKNWTLEEFWEAYFTYVQVTLIEDELGQELYEFKLESKLVIYSSLCYKTVVRDGKRIRVINFNDYIEKKINDVFELIEKQIENKNYLNN